MLFQVGHVIALSVLAVVAIVAVTGWYFFNLPPRPLDRAAFLDLYQEPVTPAQAPLRVFHLGHSLVGRDMPAALASLADGHGYESQLGWGTTMRAHWEPDVAINGAETENDHPRYRDAHEALGSGAYDVFVVTEMVNIRDAIKYHASYEYLRKWAAKALQANPKTRVYFYETWHRLDVEEGWLARLDADLETHWEGDILRRALVYDDVDQPIYVIPGGQVMAAFVRAVEAAGGVGPITSRQDLFKDDIHFNDYGAYLMALTHYAVIYGRSPMGLPHALFNADGTPLDDPGPDAARLMQDVVWQVVTSYPPTGVGP